MAKKQFDKATYVVPIASCEIREKVSFRVGVPCILPEIIGFFLVYINEFRCLSAILCMLIGLTVLSF